MQQKQIDYLCKDFNDVETELNKLPENYIIELNNSLEEALNEIETLKSKLSVEQTEILLSLCKDTVIETIVGQFGLASIILNAKDGGNVTTVHNFEKGVTSTVDDKKRYENLNDYDRKNSNYDKVDGKTFNKKRKEDFQNNDVIIDGYTGKPLAKDGTTHLDHIVSAKEIETDPTLNLVATPEQRAKIATQKENLTYTNSSLNQSKSDEKLMDWENKKDKKTGQTKAEKYEVDKKLAEEKDATARKKISSDTAKLAAKKYTKELMSTGAVDAAKSCAFAVIGFAIRDLTQTVFSQLHITLQQKGNETAKQIFTRFKDAIGQDLIKIKNNWKGMLETGIEAAITSFLSNIVVFVINLFATTLKKLVSMIRAGFVSLAQAIKLIANPPKDMPKEEIGYQAIKIITAGLIGSLSLGLSAAIEKLLQSIPGLQPIMMFPIPLKGQTVSDVIATVMSALVGGVLTTIALYFIDKFHNTGKEIDTKFKLISATGVIPQYTLIQTYQGIEKGYQYVEYLMNNSEGEFNKNFDKTKTDVEVNRENLKIDRENFLNRLKASLGE